MNLKPNLTGIVLFSLSAVVALDSKLPLLSSISSVFAYRGCWRSPEEESSLMEPRGSEESSAEEDMPSSDIFCITI